MLGPRFEGIFQVRRNPIDPNQELVNWRVIDVRTDPPTEMDTFATQPEAVADMVSRNRALQEGA